MNSAIVFDRVYKHYYLGSRRAYARYLVPGRNRAGGDVEKLLVEGDSHDKTHVWALKDVSFEVKPGEVLGIIGPNGAGKTTALSLLAGITAPTSGRIAVRGRMSALIRLGAGFHPDLTGRENIYLNASIMGLKKREVAEIVDDIIAFAELERFIDTPVKRYSSGMYVRLGFSVAVHTQPEILLIDEVLAVGDSSFKAKCYAKIRDIRGSGATAILVSHDMSQIKNLCDRAILLDGQIVAEGDVDQVVKAYYQRVFRDQESPAHEPSAAAQNNGQNVSTGPIRITNVSFFKDDVPCIDGFVTGDPLRIRIDYYAEERAPLPAFGVGIHSMDGATLIGTNTKIDEVAIDEIEGTGTVEFVVPSLTLLPGTYLVSVGLHDQFMGFYDRKTMAYRFKIVDGPVSAGVFSPPHRWELRSETRSTGLKQDSATVEPKIVAPSQESHGP